VSAIGRGEVRQARTWRGRCDKNSSDVIIRIYQLEPGSPELDPLTVLFPPMSPPQTSIRMPTSLPSISTSASARSRLQAQDIPLRGTPPCPAPNFLPIERLN
jgi:hypothetical protein